MAKFCNFLIGFTMLQILVSDPVVIKIYQLNVQKKKGKEKTRSTKSIHFYMRIFANPNILLVLCSPLLN